MKRKGNMRRDRKRLTFSSADFLDSNDDSIEELRNQKNEYKIRRNEAIELLKQKNRTLEVLLDIQKKPARRVLVLVTNLVSN